MLCHSSQGYHYLFSLFNSFFPFLCPFSFFFLHFSFRNFCLLFFLLIFFLFHAICLFYFFSIFTLAVHQFYQFSFFPFSFYMFTYLISTFLNVLFCVCIPSLPSFLFCPPIISFFLIHQPNPHLRKNVLYLRR